jgi:hypothetical protein
MAATYAELRAQLKDISERAWLIEQKYPEGDITDEKDQQASAELSAEYAEVEAKATQARQNEERRGIITSRLAELQ